MSSSPVSRSETHQQGAEHLTFTTMRFLSGPREQLHGRLKAVIIIIKSSLMEIILNVSVLDRTVSMFSISFEFKVLN